MVQSSDLRLFVSIGTLAPASAGAFLLVRVAGQNETRNLWVPAAHLPGE